MKNTRIIYIYICMYTIRNKNSSDRDNRGNDVKKIPRLFKRGNTTYKNKIDHYRNRVKNSQRKKCELINHSMLNRRSPLMKRGYCDIFIHLLLLEHTKCMCQERDTLGNPDKQTREIYKPTHQITTRMLSTWQQ